MGTLFIGGVVAIWILAGIVFLLLSIFWIIELIDIVRRQFENDAVKVIWIVVVCMSHFVGAIVYHFAGRQMGRLPDQMTS